MTLLKPIHLNAGDRIATLSISHGWSGDAHMKWKYDLGKYVLTEKYGLQVTPAPNSMKGSDYLSKNPRARAEDLIWAFENKEIKAIIANIGGNDSYKLLPFISSDIIKCNPKIFIGYSDILNIHLLCYKAGLSTFYGHNLLNPIAEQQGFHPYSEKWFRKVLFETKPIGTIEPSEDWTFHDSNQIDPNYFRPYYPNAGYELIQGKGCVTGKLFGGHTGMMNLEGTCIELKANDFDDVILFIEDIPEFFQPDDVANYFRWLGKIDAIHKLKGVLIGKLSNHINMEEHKKRLLEVVNTEYGREDLPILYGLNFGHTSPMCILPYGVEASIDCERRQFSILESGVC